MVDIARRELLKLIAAGGAAAGLAKLGGPLVALAGATPDIVVVEGADAAANVRAAVDALGGMGRFVSKGDKVVIKPNMGFGNPPQRATTTEPAVVRALAEMALNAGAKRVMVFDNPCHKANIVLDVCGIRDALKGLDDTFVYLVRRDNLFRKVAIPKGKALKRQKVAIDILEADVIINVPVAKSHGGAKVSFGMKNWMGVVKNRGFWHVVVNLHQAIADMATFIRPALTVLDATRALVTGGPGGPGKVVALRKVVAGIDPVAVDAYGLTLAKWGGKGYRPEDVPHIIKAAEHGVGTYELDRLNIVRIAV